MSIYIAFEEYILLLPSSNFLQIIFCDDKQNNK